MKNIILYINTTGEEKVALALGKAGKLIAKREFKAKYQQSEKLLPAIDLLLKKAEVKLKDLTGTAVVSGPGPFTATRIGVTVANALAYALNIKIAGLRADEFNNIETMVIKGWEALKKARTGKIIEPVYDRELNITLKVKK